MSSIRSFIILTLVSLAVVPALIYLGSVTGDNVSTSGYAVLTADKSSIEDRVLNNILSTGLLNEYLTGYPVSESSLWFLLDEFDSLNVVPLDYHSRRLLPFDPRNDGYADKLKNIFVRGDKRFVYLPLNTNNNTSVKTAPEKIERHLKELLADIPFTVDFYGIGKPLKLFFIVFAAAALALAVLIIFYHKKKINPGIICLILMLPALSSLAFFGAGGMAAAALFLGFAVVIKEPLKEFILTLRLPAKNWSIKLNMIYKNAVEPYILHFYLLPVFAAAITAVVIFGELKLFFILLVFAAAGFIFYFSVRALETGKRDGNRRRFTPIMILKQRFMDFSFSVYMLPFTIAVFFAMLLTPHVSSAYVSGNKFDDLYIINEHDYYAHLAFQTSFSTRRLGLNSYNSSSTYPCYILNEDGLPSPDYTHFNFLDTSGEISSVQEEFPPFPLSDLMDFFHSVNNSEKIYNAGTTNIYNFNMIDLNIRMELILFSILLLFVIPGFLLNKRINLLSKNSLFYKRMTKNYHASERTLNI
jgi:hypothetical protein